MKSDPLFLAPSACDKIHQQISTRPDGVESMFEVQINFKKDSYNVRVGFIERKECTTIFQYPVPIMIGKTEELFLQNCSLEYDEEKKNFYIFPDVKISVEETPNPKILKLELNRVVIHKNSESPKITLDKNTHSPIKNRLLDKIFSLGYVESLHLEKNFFSIEFGLTPTPEIEEKTVDTILKYYTDLGYQVGIKNGLVHTFIPGKEE